MAMNFDLIARVMEIVGENYDLLARCSCVNWDFNRAASRVLYSRVVISPSFRPVLNLRDTTSIPDTSNFTSALIPRNACYVLSLEIGGFISPRAPPRNTLPLKLASALALFVNLRRVQFTPSTSHEELFVPSLPALHNLRSLSELTVNSSLTDDTRAPSIVTLGTLNKLTLISPGRTILQLLPDWLDRLSKTLTELHLKANCGSITPGVLKSLIPHIAENIQALTLGLSYSLVNDDVFDFLGQLPNLRRLQLQYYWQFKDPARMPRLSSLRYFAVAYGHIHSKKEVNDLDKWVRRAIAGSPRLEELHLLCDLNAEASSEIDHGGANVAHEALLEHITRKHAKEMRVLSLRSAFVGKEALQELFRTCTNLEELHVQAGPTALAILAASRDTTLYLHTISVQIRNVKRSYKVDDSTVASTMQAGPVSLVRLSVNGILWKRERLVNVEASGKLVTEFVVQKTTELKPPWAQKVN